MPEDKENIKKSFARLAKTQVSKVMNSAEKLGIAPEKLSELLEVVDTRINKAANEFREQMAEERKEIRKHEKKSLLINLLILAAAIATAVVHKFFS